MHTKQIQNEEEDRNEELLKKKEEEELKKFIFLEKLKYEKSIKGYDRMVGLKQNLDEFTELLLQKLFMKRDGDAMDKFKYIIKQDNSHKRIDRSRPLYLDDLKRFGKLKEIGPKKTYTVITHD